MASRFGKQRPRRSPESIHEPTPLFTIQLEENHTVEFHDMGRGVGVLERGPAGTTKPQVGKIAGQPDTLASLYASVAPGKPFPAELQAVQDRLLNQAHMSPPVTKGIDGEVVSHLHHPEAALSHAGAPAAQNSGKLHAEDNTWCGNVCCDFNWMVLNMCPPSDTFNWFDFDWGWSVENGTYISSWNTDVCAAVGTSNFQTIVAGDYETDWNVNQGFFARFIWWDTNWLGEHDIYSNVNNQVQQATHTYCGAAD